MHRWIGIAFAMVLCSGGGLLPGGEGGGISWPLPNSDLGVAATAALPPIGTVDVSPVLFAPRAEGTIVDQYGAAMAGVIICVGPNEADASPLAETDSGGAYSAALDADALAGGPLRLWPFLPLTRFDPEGYVFEGYLLGGSDYNFVGVPSIYPVPPERDCR
jgi:hypothetical protein